MGGQCTLPRLWDLGWRGAAVCHNAGCNRLGKVPQSCALSLVTGGLDFFPESSDPDSLTNCVKRDDANLPILLYHDPKMGHSGAPDDFEKHGHYMLPDAVLLHLVQLTACGSQAWSSYRKGDEIDGPWPEDAY